jgi:hypothetical protein
MTTRISRWRILFLVAVCYALTAGIASAQSYTLSGTVYGGGSPLANTVVEALNNGTTSAVATMTTSGNGQYALSLLNGTYDLRVTPPSGSSFGQEILQDIVINGANRSYDVILLAAGGGISGTVRGLGGTLLANVSVNAYTQQTGQFLASAQTDANGRYSLAASGTVRMDFSQYNYSTTNTTAPQSWQHYRYDVVVSGATTVNVDLPVIRVSGTVSDSGNNTVANVNINANANGGNYPEYFYSSGNASSDATGAYSMLLFPSTSALFNLYPPSGTSYSAMSESGVPLSGDTTRNFTLPSTSPISGTVRGLNGTPLASVSVNAYTQQTGQFLASAQTDAAGRYSLAAAGTVRMDFSQYNYSTTNTTAPQSWQHYRYDVVVSGATTVDVDLPVVRVIGKVSDSNGAGVSNVNVNANANGGTYPLYFYSNGSTTSDTDGAYSMLLFPSTSAQFNLYPPSQSGFLPSALSGVQLTGDLTQRIILQHPDLAAPLITAGPTVISVSDTTASISWTTNEASNSHVDYGIGSTSQAASNSSMVTNHQMTLVGLTPSTTYVFRVSSTDAAGNGPTFGGPGTFTTQAERDLTPPRITQGPTVSSIDQTSAIVQWTTDEPATTSLNYGPTGGLGTVITDSASGFTLTHSIRLTGLTAETIYYAQVTSADPHANSTSSSVFDFRTLAVPDTAPPVISGLTILSKTDTKITVQWTTNEPATSGVSYNDGFRFGVVSDSSLTTTHEITLAGLSASTLYNITVSSTDAAGNGPTLATTSAATDAAPDTEAPVITGITVRDIGETSALVAWLTHELSNSEVRFGTVSGTLDSVKADIQNVSGGHAVLLTGLTEGTKYFFRVKSVDPSGNSTTSDESSFKTLSSYVDQPPTAPGPITAPVLTKETSFNITWGAATDDIGIVSYEVLRDGAVVATVACSITTYMEGALSDGSHVYQVRANDGASHTASSATVTVVVDRTAPRVNADNVSAEATGQATSVSFSVLVSDGIDANPSITCSPASGSSFAVGDTPVTCTALDAAGNQGTGGLTVTVRDTTPPNLNVPAGVTVEAVDSQGAPASFTATASDLVSQNLSVTCTPASQSTFPLGATSVLCEATDAALNKGTATFKVTVSDTTAPVVQVPADMIVEAISGSGGPASFTVTGLDKVSGSLAAECNPASGATFQLGITTVECSATDAAGNIGHGSFRVTVRDTTPPTLTPPSNLVLEAGSGNGAVGIFTVEVTDAVSKNLAAACSPVSGSTFALGVTTVKCSATDGAGNRGYTSFTVTVRDTTAPTITLVTPSQQTLWPPDHKMVTLTASVAVTDSVTGAPACRVVGIVSNEAVNNTGDGDTAPDWTGATGLSFQLRAERAGNGRGRIYTVTVECQDAAGNRSTKATTVSVPLNKSSK